MHYSRRTILKTTGLAGTALLSATAPLSLAATADTFNPPTATINTRELTIGYESSGNSRGIPIILLHGFPDDVRAWDGVAAPLAGDGHRILVPYLRGYGTTRLRDPGAPRMAEQAAIGQDLIDFADALGLERFAVAGYDWGGRAACIAAALHPERVRAAVLIGGYTIQDTLSRPRPDLPEVERAHWYQWYLNTPRGQAALETNRQEFCKYLWREWSPGWNFSDETYLRTARSFDNPDFVDLVIHSYRHRNVNAPGDPRLAAIERQLAAAPKIHAPSIVLRGANDGVNRPPADLSNDRRFFTALADSRVIQGAGHFLPREKPEAVTDALRSLLVNTR
jgi:pimeloyl-ACP methyl ester carboxylesterase